MTPETALIHDNFINVCETLNIDHETAIDFDFAEDDLTIDELRDIAFGVGYVRGLADAWDMTALQVVDEAAAAAERDCYCPGCNATASRDDVGTVCTNCRRSVIEVKRHEEGGI